MNKFLEATDILSDELSFLRDLGYQGPVSSTESSRLLGDSLLLTYESAFGRSVEIGYAPGGQRPTSVSVFVCNSNGDKFSLEDWIAARSPEFDIHFVAKAGESESEFLTQLSRGVRDLSQGTLHSTFAGADWDAVAFDWKGYR